jgi:hypothetical protein
MDLLQLSVSVCLICLVEWNYGLACPHVSDEGYDRRELRVDATTEHEPQTRI